MEKTMATKTPKAAAKETTIDKVEAPKPVVKKAPTGPVVYKTVAPQTNRLLVAGFRPRMPELPGICYYKVPADDVAAFERTKEFKGGIVVRDE